MAKQTELLGKVFGRLTVIGTTPDRSASGNIVWSCQCECGNSVLVPGVYLRNGNTRSCGCLRKENFNNRKHGLSHDPLYEIWTAMLQRCYNPKCQKYEHWGGRGIGVCDEWRHDFQTFYDWSMQNGYKRIFGKGRLTIDRRNNDEGYGPNNCRWTTYSVQNSNRRRL
jgi:hypothetical protein